MARRPSLPGILSSLRSRPERVASDQIFKSGAGGFSGGTGGAGPQGDPGRDAGFRYVYLTDTAATDPGVGSLKFNSTTFASINSLRISETDADTNTLFNFLATVDDPISTIKGHILMRKIGSPGTFALFSITGTLTDNGTWDSLPIALVLTAGAFNNNDGVMLNFLRTGDKGDTGATGSPGAPGTNGSPGPAGGPLPAARLATAAALPAYTRTANVLLANANGALPSIDGVTPAVNDLVLLVNGAAGADNGVYNIDAVGSAGAKWQMTRYVSMDTSAELVPGMLVTVAQGAANGDTIWQLATDGPITLNTTALTFARKPKDFGLVTSLPANPVTGDRCTYTDSLATPTIRWDAVYNGSSSSSSKWEITGGNPLFSEVTTDESTASTTYAALATAGPSVTPPVSGDYMVTQTALVYAAGISCYAWYSYDIGATGAVDADAAIQYNNVAEGEEVETRTRKKLALTGAQALVSKYKRSGGAGTPHWYNRSLSAMPIRIG